MLHTLLGSQDLLLILWSLLTLQHNKRLVSKDIHIMVSYFFSDVFHLKRKYFVPYQTLRRNILYLVRNFLGRYREFGLQYAVGFLEAVYSMYTVMYWVSDHSNQEKLLRERWYVIWSPHLIQASEREQGLFNSEITQEIRLKLSQITIFSCVINIDFVKNCGLQQQEFSKNTENKSSGFRSSQKFMTVDPGNSRAFDCVIPLLDLEDAWAFAMQVAPELLPPPLLPGNRRLANMLSGAVLKVSVDWNRHEKALLWILWC